MKTTTDLQKRSTKARSIYGLGIRGAIIGVLIFTGMQAPLQAQTPQFTKPTWWFGAASGANFNFYRGTTRELNSSFTAPAPFHNGMGVGLYLAPLVEFHRPDSRWGAMFQAGYDSRKGSFNPVTYYPCNCETDLTTKLTYVTVEPSLRFAPFKSGFYMYAGPRLAFNVENSFVFQQTPDPESGQNAGPAVTGDLSDMSTVLLSMQVGAGFDIPLWSQEHEMQGALSPFVSFHPYFGQNPRSIESWRVTTLRVGAALKFGRGQIIPAPLGDLTVLEPEPVVNFSVNSPKNIPSERTVTEIFPLRNYVFFNSGSTEIPDRYVLLRKDQVKDFKEDQLEVWVPKNLSGRSARQMTVYYNVLNILGDRLSKNPTATINLIGSSQSGSEDGRAMALSVREYLVDVFGISASRITTEGRDKPKLPSEQPGATTDLALREDRRVSIESSSPALLQEFQSGTGILMKPVQMTATQTAPIDSYVSFNANGANEAYSSWSLEIKDKNGKVQYFGPYTSEIVRIPGKSILGTTPEGDYKVTMVGQTKSGKTVRKETSVHMVLWTPTGVTEGSRHSVIFDFDEADAISIYDKYLAEFVAPKIPRGGTVIIHGYTDIIGEEAYNHDLSHARATEVRRVVEGALTKAGRGDVKFEVYGFGEDESLSPFENRFPEERFYNRTVIIDIIPSK